MEKIEAKKLAMHIAKLKHADDPVRIEIATSLLRDFPNLLLEVERQTSLLIHEKIGQSIVARLLLDTDREDVLKFKNEPNVTTAVTTYLEKKMGTTFARTETHSLQFLDELEKGFINHLISDPTWKDSVLTAFNNEELAAEFFTGKVFGLTNSKLHILYETSSKQVESTSTSAPFNPMCSRLTAQKVIPAGAKLLHFSTNEKLITGMRDKLNEPNEKDTHSNIDHKTPKTFEGITATNFKMS
ncbi:hypothetical protein TUMSATVNIG1_60280 (plasmid) [Vibrio nigripulchritudo]|uniref:hypothetical protein n=1 Tax=Vibrio nigripulchritudo TaxID=28173 RepID=UPI00190A5C25|nr:hypothetical protein [Vibrio nigripulchritudo]BCL74042.1 hypothetical protein VNTUMSATTG_59790 [Vibrio nigripulchritudo]BDU35419.1 hypothetical protein TUMSATVNIG1_60280 [Vibrio nigripulchritudo]